MSGDAAIMERVASIEHKLDVLIDALAGDQDDEDGPGMDLAGNVTPARDRAAETF